jgi:hypothetical protein
MFVNESRAGMKSSQPLVSWFDTGNPANFLVEVVILPSKSTNEKAHKIT